MDDFLRWLPVVILVIQALMAWGLWSLKQQFVTRHECSQSRQFCGSGKDSAVKEATMRINELETAVHALPSRVEFMDLGNKMGRLAEKIGTLDGRLGGINRAVDILNRHHLEEGE